MNMTAVSKGEKNDSRGELGVPSSRRESLEQGCLEQRPRKQRARPIRTRETPVDSRAAGAVIDPPCPLAAIAGEGLGTPGWNRGRNGVEWVVTHARDVRKHS